MRAVTVPSERTMSRIRDKLLEHGVGELALTPPIAARIAARRRARWSAWAGALVPGVIFLGFLSWSLATHVEQISDTAIALGLIVSCLSMMGSALVSVVQVRRVDRQLAVPAPRQPAWRAAGDFLTAAGGWYIASWIMAYYGSAVVGAALATAAAGESGVRPVVLGYVAGVVLLGIASAAALVTVARHATAGTDRNSVSAEKLLRHLDNRILFMPYPLLLAFLVIPSFGFQDLAGSTLRLYASVAILGYAIATMRGKNALRSISPLGTPARGAAAPIAHPPLTATGAPRPPTGSIPPG